MLRASYRRLFAHVAVDSRRRDLDSGAWSWSAKALTRRDHVIVFIVSRPAHGTQVVEIHVRTWVADLLGSIVLISLSRGSPRHAK